MVLGKRWLFSIGNGAEIRPLEKGRKGPELKKVAKLHIKTLRYKIIIWKALGNKKAAIFSP